MLDRSLDSLYPHNVDLHYHAGQERQLGTTLEDYLEHALLTGRLVLGLTDHLAMYIGQPLPAPSPTFSYEQSVSGLLRYRQDVDAARGRFPQLRIFFGAEIHANKRIDLRQLPREVVNAVDYLHSSLPFDETSIAACTASRVLRVREVAEMRERTGKPVYICHPFREPVDLRLVKRPIPEWVTAMPPRPSCDFSEEELARFFGFDVHAVARACSECRLPIEINGETDARIRGSNLPAPRQMLWASYRCFRDEGVSFVPGSDQHSFKQGAARRGDYVPFDAFDWLGITVRDMPFVLDLLRGAP